MRFFAPISFLPLTVHLMDPPTMGYGWAHALCSYILYPLSSLLHFLATTSFSHIVVVPIFACVASRGRRSLVARRRDIPGEISPPPPPIFRSYGPNHWLHCVPFRVVQLNLTPEIEVFYMLFDRSLSISSMTSVKQHMEYSYFRF